jgi:uncharacterized protein (DUF433 family)
MTSTQQEPTPRFNVGVYSLSEVSSLVRKPKDWVKRTVRGYPFRGRKGQRSSSPPLFRGTYEGVAGIINLSFLDLIELLFVRDFREHGVSMPVIRRAAVVAADMFKNIDHPFCLQRFSTDGKRIFATAASEEGDEQMIDLVQRQHVFSDVMEPFLKQLDYSEAGELLRWFPQGKKGFVVLDPRFSFGAPVLVDHNVPTSVLYRAHKAGEPDKTIASWYEVPERAVRAAIEFESTTHFGRGENHRLFPDQRLRQPLVLGAGNHLAQSLA